MNLSDTQIKLLEEIELRESAENDFYQFVKQAWHIIEPGTKFVHGWHLQILCEHIEELVAVRINNLIANLPFRIGKTIIVSICLTAWVWIKNPSYKLLYASHTQPLSEMHAREARKLIESDWYQSRWGHIYQLSEDQNEKRMYSNDKGGYRIATSVRANPTGLGANLLILDDPNDTSESDLMSEKTNEWVSATWNTRLNDRATGCKLINQQRTKEKDVTGYTLANDINKKWVSYIIPMEYEIRRKAKTIPLKSTNGQVWEDPRTVEKQLLWPEKIGPEELKEMKNDLMTQYRIAGQLQQLPAPEDGGLIKRSYFQIWPHPHPPQLLHVIQSWDTAVSKKEDACYSACTTWGIFQNGFGTHNIILLSMWRGMVEYPVLRRLAQKLYYNYCDDNINNLDAPISMNKKNMPDVILVESKHVGHALVQDLIAAGIPATAFFPDKFGDKIARVKLVSHLIENKLIWVPGKPPKFDTPRNWADLFITQCSYFPKGESRDLVDTLTQVLIRLKNGWLSNTKDITTFKQSKSYHNESEELYY